MNQIAPTIATFAPVSLPPESAALRAEVRAFLAAALASYTPVARARSWMAFDADFSRKLGEHGWIAMTWPRRYGGHERSALDRYVVSEELLAAGAPVGAHWIADRQTGPLLLRFGTEAQRSRWLPGIARGEIFFSIGMSEPDSGSDLASIRTRAVRDGDGWRLSGRKVWTTNAHRNHAMIALARTAPSEDRHGGLSQFIVPLTHPGVTVRPIKDLSGAEDFNEIVLDDVALDGDALVGAEGAGWSQVTAELAFERSGPERFLSSIQVLIELIRAASGRDDPALRIAIGEATARLWTLRNMSLAVARQLQEGAQPVLAASIVKDLGNVFEQELPPLVQRLLPADLMTDPAARDLRAVLAVLLQISPSFSLRGGTREILRGIIARGLGLR